MRCLGNGGFSLHAIFNRQIAEDEKLLQFFLRDLRDDGSIATQRSRPLQRVADEFFLSRFLDRLADYSTQFQKLVHLIDRARVRRSVCFRKQLQMDRTAGPR